MNLHRAYVPADYLEQQAFVAGATVEVDTAANLALCVVDGIELAARLPEVSADVATVVAS